MNGEHLSIPHMLVIGGAATLALTMLLVASQELRPTRVNLPYLLGTIFTPHRSKAKLIGTVVHLLNGFVFTLLYEDMFEILGGATLAKGLLLGLFHAAVVLLVGLPVLPGLHPRMASETSGPTARRHLEPPGFLGLHYGVRTPIAIVAAHLVFGAILGVLYQVAGRA